MGLVFLSTVEILGVHFFFFNPSEYVWEINSRLSFDIYLSWDFKTTTTKGLFFYYYFKHGCHEYKLDIINV